MAKETYFLTYNLFKNDQMKNDNMFQYMAGADF